MSVLLMFLAGIGATVIGVLIDEWCRKEWRFLSAAVAALLLVGFAIARKLDFWG